MSVKRGNDYGNYGGRWPAIVREYDADSRTCRIEIPGITDGADPLPRAEIEFPIGDKSRAFAKGGVLTEIEILPGDPVWIAFIGGDPRYPLITGYRNARQRNDKGWRRWHHQNVGVYADFEIELRIIFSSNVDETVVRLTQRDITAKAPESIKLTAGRIDLN
ncbi:MAG: hypothetical protein EOM21_20000 [Gammaproteobacteria bacterium]|nr:hypothetical protein [Gammaproteobacteria bacterium]